MDAINTLKEPFPTKVLPLLDFGSADGRKDESLEETFVSTTSVKQFLQDRHSIVIGQIGSGKSALFELLKNRSKKLGVYRNRLIIPIEEAISFQLLRSFIAEEFSGHDKKLIYKLIWKFQILTRICEEIYQLPDFPQNQHEKEIHDYLGQIKSKEFDESVIGKLKGLLKNAALVIKTKISQSPISVEAELKGNIKNESNRSELNLDRIYRCVTGAIEERGVGRPLVIIDRIDTFVAGEDYDTQREFIEALLEVDDDIDASYSLIGRKVFLRADLFARLDYEALGYDKVNDNTLRIEWTDFELIYFVANRILAAFKKQKLITEGDVLLSTDLSEYHLFGFSWFRTNKLIPLKLRKKLFNFSIINQERDASLLERINKALITKVFPRTIVHKDASSNETDIYIFDFLLTHFKDGHGKVTPRNLLTFLKEVAIVVAGYYAENPDQEVHVKNIEGDWEWELFKKRCVYDAYCNSKIVYIQNISKVSNEWTKYFSTFIGKRSNKKTIDFVWVKSIIGLDDEKVVAFIAYLHHIGFLYIIEPHPDPRRRKYRLPIIYMPIPGAQHV
ncbi:P-loop ATPase, Sll1717 family [Nitrosomonas communis]|uniref:Uncharacterized protein n=1 Tax=Nitrosomonas communis TaxID=44574 RepID=A0A1H2X2J4_9PROT|nr:hypothetical protein [Nitrosomonas communis]SDW86489.1 hypothetical protein SAMN05421882_103327 [Nitrosomonas communis]